MLTVEQIDRLVEAKGRHRREKEERDWKSAKIGDLRKYSCKTCFHNKTLSCEPLGRGKICRYWWKPDSERIGLAYDKRTKPKGPRLARLVVQSAGNSRGY